jgi:uncharacterized membrane protein
MIGGMMGGFGSGIGGTMGGLANLILTLGFLAGMVLLGVWLWRRFGALAVAPARVIQQESAGDILRVRYARGELSRAEFQRMLYDLDGGANSGGER